MAFRAKNRDEASAYFAGWKAAEYDDKVGDGIRPDNIKSSNYLDNIRAYNFGYEEYRLYGKGKE